MTLPLPKTEVRIKRRRGGQPGNRNRLLHGRYTHTAQAQRQAVRALLKAARDLTIRAAMVARARRSYRRKQAAELEGGKPPGPFPRSAEIASRQAGLAVRSVNAASQAFQFVLDTELFFFEGGDADFVPIWMSHLRADELLQFPVLFGKFLNVPFQCHQCTSFLA